jgi:hypothetical protein
MDLSWLVRARWRMLGAWMWPMFVVLGVLDGVIGHLLPIAGDTEGVVGGLIVGLIFNLVAVILLARPLGMLLRRRRRDLPPPIARNYGGTACVMLVTVGFAALGLAHHAQIVSDRSTMHDAVERAAAYIGDHAPAPFRIDAAHLDTVTIQSDTVYRTCVANPGGTREYCVIVNETKPAADSVVPDGSESNETLARGTD